ncbi:MAG: aldehyde dehydrogenase family protein [Burkholderiales bacterium]
MSLTEQQIRQIVEETVRSLTGARAAASSSGNWLCDTMEEAIASAKSAQQQLMAMSLDKRGRLIDAMRRAAMDNVQYLSELARNETGYGKVEHKVLKNKLAIEKTPGIEDLTADAMTGDYGLTLVERAPFGVIGAITPSTNPTSTVINNSISMIAAGNAVVFNPHPSAKKSSTEAMRILNEAIVAAGGPSSLICTVKQPTLETGKALMEHKDIPLLAITGGEAVVHVAMHTGKKVIAAGPGNPPVIVDDTAIIKQAAKDIVDGASFDNNVLCIAEKEVFVYGSVADMLMNEMQKHGAYRVSGADIDRIVKTVLVQKDGKYVVNRSYVGKDATKILSDSGVSYAGNPRLVIAEVSENHPFVTVEMLMPVLGIVRVQNDEIGTAINMAIKAENGCMHTAMMHSQNVSHLSMAAKALNTTIFVKNAPSYAGLGFGGEGFTTLTIATPTGEGITSARTFTRLRRCVLYGNFRIV